MTTPLLPALPVSTPIRSTVKMKRVLLVDCSQAKRELRVEVMKRLGVDVDRPANIAEVVHIGEPPLYDLALINVEKAAGFRDRFCHAFRTVAAPPQRLAFLISRLEYFADSPHGDEESARQSADDQTLSDLKIAFALDRGDLAHQWGSLEASRRISAVQTTSLDRTQAMPTLPAAARDSERHLSKRTATPNSLDDLLKEELQ